MERITNLYMAFAKAAEGYNDSEVIAVLGIIASRFVAAGVCTQAEFDRIIQTGAFWQMYERASQALANGDADGRKAA